MPGWRVAVFSRRFGIANDAAYQTLLRHRTEIEDAFGSPLEWQAKESNRSRKAIFHLELGGWSDPDNWPEAIEPTVDAMVRFERAIGPHLPEAAAAAEAVDLTTFEAEDNPDSEGTVA